MLIKTMIANSSRALFLNPIFSDKEGIFPSFIGLIIANPKLIAKAKAILGSPFVPNLWRGFEVYLQILQDPLKPNFAASPLIFVASLNHGS